MGSWKSIKELIEYPKEGILSKVLFSSEGIDATLFCMANSSEISEHTSTRPGVVYVVEGKGIFRLKGRKIAMLPDVLIHMEKNAVHSLKAEKSTSFLLMLFGSKK